jgi:hypothetical protein
MASLFSIWLISACAESEEKEVLTVLTVGAWL